MTDKLTYEEAVSLNTHARHQKFRFLKISSFFIFVTKFAKKKKEGKFRVRAEDKIFGIFSAMTTFEA